MLETLFNVFKVAAQAPQILNNPVLARLFNQLVEVAGVSPLLLQPKGTPLKLHSSCRRNDSTSRMNYELAKELSDAGFLQMGKGDWIGPPDALVWRSADKLYAPTLADLIEACGDEFDCLERDVEAVGEKNDVYWCAYAHRLEVGSVGQDAETAVARLWLALNKKV